MSTPNPTFQNMINVVAAICKQELAANVSANTILVEPEARFDNGVVFDPIKLLGKYYDSQKFENGKQSLKEILEYYSCDVNFDNDKIKITFPSDMAKKAKLANNNAKDLMVAYFKSQKPDNSNNASAQPSQSVDSKDQSKKPSLKK